MLPRFCLYGFLKNQQYFDPFLFLALRQKGLSFAAIGVLIGFRAISVNLTEIPAGAVADVLGRRRLMIASFIAYIGSFLLFGLCDQLTALFAAMFLFSMGTAFRTGTHKAMIAVGALAGAVWLAVAGFVLLAVFQNLWRPILISRVAEEARPSQTATILSVESQAKSLFVAVAAPTLGWAVDFIGKHGAEGACDIGRFLPIAVLGIVVSGVVLIASHKRR